MGLLRHMHQDHGVWNMVDHGQLVTLGTIHMGQVAIRSV